MPDDCGGFADEAHERGYLSDDEVLLPADYTPEDLTFALESIGEGRLAFWLQRRGWECYGPRNQRVTPQTTEED